MKNLLVYSPLVVLVLYVLAFVLLLAMIVFSMLDQNKVVNKLLVAFVPTGTLLLVSVVVFAILHD